MKIRLLNILVCPECENEVMLNIFVKDNVKYSLESKKIERPGICFEKCQATLDTACHQILEGKINCELCHKVEIMEGLLTCKGCLRQYPIINGIPRLLPDVLKISLFQYHPDFFKKYATNLQLNPESFRSVKDKRHLKITERTLSSFSYQWKKFPEIYEYFEQNFLEYIHPINREFFFHKMGLDAGCGFGRHLYYASKFGAEMVGVDVSDAVETAFDNTKELSRVHIIQGDIHNLPFKRNCFDFIYSIGVLHHLPNPKVGFKSLTKFLKPGSSIFIWVYGYVSDKRKDISDRIAGILRRTTTKWPHPLLYCLCLLIAVPIYICLVLPIKIMNKIPFIRSILNRIFLGIFSRKLPITLFKPIVTNIFDRLSVPVIHYHNQEELRSWLEEDGLQITKMSKMNKRSWRVLGRSLSSSFL